MSEFPYASIRDDQKWTVVSDAADRRSISPQGPVKFTLPRTAKIASAGSCFGQRLAERLPGLGLDCLVAEPAGAPFSARWGTIYNVLHLQQLLERALERFVPLERAWPTAEGRFIDPFRPSIEPAGFATPDAVEEDRRRHLAAVRRLFAHLDVFIFTLGLTEYWSDVRDGAVFPMCPGRGRGVFDPERYVHANAGVPETCAALDAFLALLGEINPGARVVLTVSPVPIAATLEPMHVVRASVLTKSVLKVAAEAVAASHHNVDYFATYDMVTANLGGETLYAADGRHVVGTVADRVTRLFAASYFGFDDATPPAGADETERLTAALAGDCDEDRLLALLSAERARSIARGPRAEVGSVEHPTPLFFVGDSGSVTFRDSLYRLPQFPDTFVGRGLHTPGLYAGELADADGRLNAAVLAALVSAGVLRTAGRDAYSVQPDYNRMLGLAGGLRMSPPVTLFCGALDANRLWTLLDSALIEIPAALGRGAWPHRTDDVPFDEAVAIALPMLERFELGLRLLKSYGLEHLAVHVTTPLADEPAAWHANPWHDLIAIAQRALIVINHCIAQICERVGVLHVDIWPDVTGADGWRDPRYTLDAGHLNFEASLLSVGRLLDAFAARSRYAYV